MLGGGGVGRRSKTKVQSSPVSPASSTCPSQGLSPSQVIALTRTTASSRLQLHRLWLDLSIQLLPPAISRCFQIPLEPKGTHQIVSSPSTSQCRRSSRNDRIALLFPHLLQLYKKNSLHQKELNLYPIKLLLPSSPLPPLSIRAAVRQKDSCLTSLRVGKWWAL